MAYSSLPLANSFLQRALTTGRSLTQMQLQKLVYLSHGWHLAETGEPLSADKFEAWQFGPVNRKLYNALSRYGSNPVVRLIRWGDDTPFRSDDGIEALDDLDLSAQTVLNTVWEVYGHYPAFKLSALTHQNDTPWSTCFQQGRNTPIPDEMIRDHFRQLAPAG